MDKICDTDSKFQFDKLVLSKPISQSGGYFIKYSMNDYPLYIRPPKASIKQIVKSLKKSHCDLVFSQENDEFIQWMENLENYSQKIIFKNREQWFESGLELEDIENSFTSPMKTYKSGKFHILRTNITQRLGKTSIKIYNEDENDILLDDVSGNMNVMTILEIQGIKCSSKSFQIEIELKQMMVLNTIDLFEKCILKSGQVIYKSDNLGKIDLEKTIEIPETVEKQEEIKDEVVKQEEIQQEEEKQEEIQDEVVKIVEKQEENTNELCEVDFNLDEMPEIESIKLKERDDVYYEMYREARRKAKVAKDLALSAFLEAKQIKNKYMLDDISDSDESDADFDEDQ